VSEETSAGTEPAANPAAEPETPPEKKSNGSRRKKGGFALVLIICLMVFFGVKWWLRSQTHITTDDAFIDTHVHSVSSRVPGTVTRVYVTDNQYVKRGELLVDLDPADYRVKAASAAAALEMARNETSGEYAQVESARAGVSLARARLDQAELDLKRGEALFLKEVIPREQLDRLQTAHRMAQSQLKEAEEKERKERALIGLTGSNGKEARVAQKAAQFSETKLNLSYTRIYAPVDGFITKKSVEIGNIVQTGQPLMALVTLDDAWVTANYKERQLTYVRPGQRVDFAVDAYPDRTFHGTVDSIMAGTGAAFSLLPPENATGNYVKVVQRIPVKIHINQESDPQRLLRVGMSVVPTVITDRSIIEILKGLNPFK
jgi:membrane fusion protein (multidrug efflux system)